MDAAEFHASVYETVRQIPPQKVTTYGHIAKLIGMPNHSRHVGQALKFISPDVHPPIPWYRVVSSSGAISSRGPGTDGARRQRDELIAEGVEVSEFTAGGGGGKVDMGRWGWFPDPGQWRESVDEDEDGEEGDEHEA